MDLHLGNGVILNIPIIFIEGRNSMPSNDRIPIRLLPEKYSILAGDYLVVEDLEDTWKVKGNVLISYLDDHIKAYQTTIDTLIENLRQTISDVEAGEQERDRKEAEREQIFQQYEQRLEDALESITGSTGDLQDIFESEAQRKEDFENMKKYFEEVQNAEATRVQNETDRVNAEEDRNKAYEDLLAFLQQAQQAENARVEAESERQSNELQRNDLYQDMNQLYQDTEAAEQQRTETFAQWKEIIDNINTRLDGVDEAEAARQQAEQQRTNTFTIWSEWIAQWQQAEEDRALAESNRVSAEEDRVQAESEREETFDQIRDFIENFEQTAYPAYAHPIGSIYATTTSDNPATILLGGTWKLIGEAGINMNVTRVPDDPLAAEEEVSIPNIYLWMRTA